MTSSSRLPGLDILRALAILLVLMRHMVMCPPTTSAALFEITSLLQRGGWVGVDIFFVLSGFLVGGLLFRELAETGQIRYGRFFVRRGFKIYPLLWFSLALVLAVRAFEGVQTAPQQILAELFFFANYSWGVLGVTWSLAVEEHFYLLLPLALYLFHRIGRAGVAGVVKGWPLLVIGVASACLTLRFFRGTGAALADDYATLFPTELRLDGLFFGVLLAYWHQFRRQAFLEFAQRNRGRLLLYGLVGLCPAFLLPASDWFIRVPGLTINYLASGALLVSALTLAPTKNRVVGVLTGLGRQSYGTYLLHYWCGTTLLLLVWKGLGWQHLAWPVYAALYVGLALGSGALVTWLVERPMLRLRDRWFPAGQVAPSPEARISTALTPAPVPVG